MALSEELKEKLYLHLKEQDTLQQKLAFRKLLRENTELAEVYYQLRDTHNPFAPEEYKSTLFHAVEEAYTHVEQPHVQPPIYVVKESRPWLDELRVQLTKLINRLPFPTFLAGTPQLQLVHVAFSVIVLFSLGWGAYSWKQSVYETALFDAYGNEYGPHQGGEPTKTLEPECDKSLKDTYYLYSKQTSSAEIKARIEKLQKESDIPESCKAYYLGRAYMWQKDYQSAIQSLKQARLSTNKQTQEMATFDLGLTFFLAGEKAQAFEVLNSQSNWSNGDRAIQVENLKQAAE